MTLDSRSLTALEANGLFHRPARSEPPAADPELATIRRPPLIEEGGSGAMGFMGLIPLLGMAGSMTVMMLFRGSPFAAVGALMMIVTVIGAIVMMTSQNGKQTRRRKQLRDNYLEYLEERHHELRTEEAERRSRAQVTDPRTSALVEMISTPSRLWERRRQHSDYLNVRCGIGDATGVEFSLEGEDQSIESTDPHLEQQLEVLQDRFATTPDMPLRVHLGADHTVSVIGDTEFCDQAIRNLVLQAVSLHSPEDLQLAFLVPPAARENWEWVRRLPHILDQEQPTAFGPVPRISETMSELSALLRSNIQRRYQTTAELRRTPANHTVVNLNQPRLLVIDLRHSGPVEDFSAGAATDLEMMGITVIHALRNQLEEPGDVSARLVQNNNSIHNKNKDRKNQAGLSDGGAAVPVAEVEVQRLDADGSVAQRHTGVLDESDVALAQAISRVLAPMRLSHDSLEHSEQQAGMKFTQLLGLKELDEQHLQRSWEPNFGPDFLTVPIGLDQQGKPVRLDIKEAAQHGMGPHGLCVGATGSGKSELLRTLVLGLALTHSPEQLNLVLVDYKGGATFAPFKGIPHVSGIVTNLADDVSLVDRIYASLEGEVLRRQEQLKAAGNIASITDYQRARRRNPDLPVMPHLFLVIDEFGELLTAQPDFIDLFMSIGRIGRSIGVHLLLSSQRLEAGKLRGLDTYLSYRLGLRTLSEAESRTVLETTDAFHLPPLPGYGYLKVDTTVYEQFKAGYVSGPLAIETAEDSNANEASTPVVLIDQFYAQNFMTATMQQDEADDEAEASKPVTAGDDVEGPTVLSASVDMMSRYPAVTDPIWLPPLLDKLTLDQALSMPQELLTEPTHPQADAAHSIMVPIGVLDDPAHQWQGRWEIDLTHSGGHIAILGGPATGKSTLLRTMALSLALENSPREVTMYGLDLRGSGLLAIEGLPHTAGVAVRTRRESLRRTLEEVTDLLTEREALFESLHIDSVSTMREMFASDEHPELDVCDVVLFVDGWGGLIDEFEDLQDSLYSLLTRGSGYGIHIIATATRWNEVRMAQQSFFGTRLEMRLTEPSDSMHGSKTAAHLPKNRPGRGFNIDGRIGQVALPRIDDEPSDDGLTKAFNEAVEIVKMHYPRQTPRTVRLLPTHIHVDELPAAPAPGHTRFGVLERNQTIRYLDFFGREPHLAVLADEEAGKTSLLRVLAHELMQQYSSEELVFAVFDPRRDLQNVIPEEYLGGYAASAMHAEQLTAAVVKEVQSRVQVDPLKQQSAGFEGPRIVLLVDDYDVLTAGAASPLHAFTPFLAMSGDIGLHVALTRRVRGASRTMYEPFFASLREAGAVTLLMDGDSGEGPIIGRIRPRHFPAGRGILIRPNEAPQTIQLVTLDEEAQD